MSTTAQVTLGERIRAERHRHSMTLAEVGAGAGVGRSHVCDIEHGRRLPSYEVCMDILRTLGLSEREAMRGFIVSPEVIEWATTRVGLAKLLDTMAHFDATDAELHRIADKFVRDRTAKVTP